MGYVVNGVARTVPSPDTVGSAQLVDGSIVAVDLHDDAVTLAKLHAEVTAVALGGDAAGAAAAAQSAAATDATTKANAAAAAAIAASDPAGSAAAVAALVGDAALSGTQTTSGAETKTLAAFALATDTSWAFRALVIAARSDHTSPTAFWLTFAATNAGDSCAVSDVDVIAVGGALAADAITVDVSGTSARVLGTGLAMVDYSWRLRGDAVGGI